MPRMPSAPTRPMPGACTVLYLVTLLLCALVAGLLYGYACSVNPGLARLPDAEYLRAMQGINAAIQNPVFFLSFLGAGVALPLCAWVRYRHGAGAAGGWLLAAAVLYAVGVFGVTAAGNVPLNNRLAAADLAALTPAGLRAQRSLFEGPWNRYHTVRTVCAAGVFVLAVWPAVRRW